MFQHLYWNIMTLQSGIWFEVLKNITKIETHKNFDICIRNFCNRTSSDVSFDATVIKAPYNLSHFKSQTNFPSAAKYNPLNGIINPSTLQHDDLDLNFKTQQSPLITGPFMFSLLVIQAGHVDPTHQVQSTPDVVSINETIINGEQPLLCGHHLKGLSCHVAADADLPVKTVKMHNLVSFDASSFTRGTMRHLCWQEISFQFPHDEVLTILIQLGNSNNETVQWIN